jgi:hypothetical protein
MQTANNQSLAAFRSMVAIRRLCRCPSDAKPRILSGLVVETPSNHGCPAIRWWCGSSHLFSRGGRCNPMMKSACVFT